MTHAESNLATKLRIAGSLKRKMMVKPLSKITVSELIADCDINRKTFYYHFEDIPALLKWILEQEAFEIAGRFDLMEDLEGCLEFVLDYVDSNAHILNCAYDSLGRDAMRRFLISDFMEIIRRMTDQMQAELGLSVTADYSDFVCRTFTEIIASTLIDCFQSKAHAPGKGSIEYLTIYAKCAVPALLKNGPRWDRAVTEPWHQL